MSAADPFSDPAFLKKWAESHFARNLTEARENGYDLVCAECGSGIYDDSDMHERGCSKYPEGGYA